MITNKYWYSIIIFCLVLGTTIAYNNTSNLEKWTSPNFINPTIDFSFDKNEVCSGTSISFASDVSGNGPFEYLWDFGDGQTSIQANPKHSFQALGCDTATLKVKLTVTDSKGDVSTVSHDIKVKQKPNINFSDLNQSYSDPFDNCNSASQSYTVNVGNESPSANCVLSYDINWGDGTSETNISFPLSHTYTQLGAFDMVITAFGENGCNNSKKYLVKNSTNPIGAIEIPGNTVNLCLPVDPINFAIGSWGTNPPDTVYNVDYGDGVVEQYTQDDLEASSYYNSSNPSASQNFPIPHIYTESNCPNNDFTVYLTITTSCDQSLLTAGPIKILKKPEVDFEVDDIACVNTPVQFTNTTIDGYNPNCTTNANFFWDFGDGSTSTSQSPSHIYTAPGNYTISLYAENYCGTTDPVTQTICIESEIEPSFSLDTNNGCSDLNVVISNTTDTSQSCSTIGYLWTVTYSPDFCGTTSEWSFVNGTDETSMNPSITFEVAGSYNLSLSVTNSCGTNTISEIISVKQPPTVSIESIPDYCGSVLLEPTAIVSTCTPLSDTVSYSWSFPGGIPSSSDQLDPGIINYEVNGDYEIQFSATNSCGTVTVTENFSINETPTITNSETTQTLCSGTESEMINLTSENINTIYTWTSNSPTGLTGYQASGTSDVIPSQTLINTTNAAVTLVYTVIPQIGDCTGAPVNFEIVVEPAPVIVNQPLSNAVCLSGEVDDLYVDIQGTGTVSYQWFENTVNDTSSGTAIAGEASSTFSPPTNEIGSTYYYVVISFSSGGCSEIISDTALIEVTNSSAIDAQPLSTQSICVGGQSEELAVNVVGGTGTISYQWYNSITNSSTGGTLIAGANSANYTPPTFVNTGTFYYYVEISASGSGCSALTSEVAEIVVVDDPVIIQQPLVFQSLCQNVEPEDLEVAISDGLGNVSYQWYVNTVNDNSGGTLIAGANMTTYTPSADTVGTFYYYCVISQDVSGCEVTSDIAEVEVSAGAQFEIQPVSSELCLGETTNALSVSYTNGSDIANYQWFQSSVNEPYDWVEILGETSASYMPDVSVVGTSYYYCIITFNTGGCSEIASDVAEIVVNETPNVSDESLIICSGNSFEYIPNNLSGDIVPLNTMYSWGTPQVNPIGSITGATSQLTPIASISQFLENTTTNPAIVTYVVTPISGDCMGENFEVIVTVNPSISIVSNLTDNSCYQSNDGSIEITVVGGVPFQTGAPYQITWSGPNGFFSNDEDIFGLEQGTYLLTIEDNGGCPFTESFIITEPEELDFNGFDFDPNTISCYQANDGEIGVNVVGGTQPYTINWTKDGVPFSSDEDLMDLGPGNYEVSVTDANSCGPIEQSFMVEEPDPLEITLERKTDVLCYGDNTGGIFINVSGGRPEYSYAWTGPNGFVSTDENIEGLFAGIYNLNITDISGCIDTLEVEIIQNEAIDISITTTEIECYGDNNASIVIENITGGIPPYDIAWSNFGLGNSQYNLSAGTYIITITDAVSCEKQFPVVIEEAPIFLIEPMVTQMSCAGENDASIVLNFQGGIDPVTVVWDDDSTVGVERNNLAPGTYTVTITDGTPCVIQDSFTIYNIDPLLISANIVDALDCDDTNSGAINLLIQGGTPPYSVVWSNGVLSEDLINIPPNTYFVEVTDANGCEIQGEWSVNRFDPLVLNVETESEVDCEEHSVSQTFSAVASGGVPPFQYNWSSGIVSGNNGEFMTTEENGLVMLEVVDSYGCIANYSLNVDIPVLGEPDFTTSSFGYLNYGVFAIQDPIQFTNTATGDFVSVLWDFGDGNFSSEINPIHTYVEVGNYVVVQTVTYPFGCVYTNIVTLIVEKGYKLEMPDAFTPNDDGLNDFFGPVYRGLHGFELKVYDTWGSVVYSETGDDIRGWDGKVKDEEAENGNYYYTISAKTFYGDEIVKQNAFVFIK
ncbi:PKD domain-containing protein [Mangrovimonas sp. DI 80]|uniref:PKD domain-containing protein n=1 Tax=Mangrovimonas sp. DI 80 TaxID=1779330 RepID=UPI000978A4AF|nr:PKD domain-containing protein [Mangrovimonas sp. DI 80]OMP29954.1 hypothetical protein BKM32_15230 [Mangrovimonas sp. DI 80]